MKIEGFLKEEFDWYIAISRGGLLPACLLSKITDVRNIDTICIYSYDEENKQGNLQIEEKDFAHIKGKKVLIIDDLTESGDTLKLALKYLKKFEPAEVKTFVVYKKVYNEGKNKNLDDFESDYFLKEWPGDVWIDFEYDEMDFEKMIKFGLKSNLQNI